MKYSVTLPLYSRSKLPVAFHVRRFEDANHYSVYLRAWSEAGFVVLFDGPFSARIVGAGE